MKYRCTQCDSQSSNINLWCQRPECSFRNVTDVFEPGEYVNEFKIISVMRIMRHATLYQADFNGTLVFLKVSHFDIYNDPTNSSNLLSEYGEYIKAEAEQFVKLNEKVEPSVAKWFQPYSKEQLPNQSDKYGKTTINDKLRYYIAFQPIENAIFLRDLMNEYPQLPPQQVAWIIAELAQTLVRLNTRLGIHHFALSPDTILVRHDNDGRWRPVLIDLGIRHHLMNFMPRQHNDETDSQFQLRYHRWLFKYLHPAYIAPDIYRMGTIDMATDIHNLGLIAYEMLTGRPVHEYENRTAEMIVNSLDRRIPYLNRGDLHHELTEFIYNLVSLDYRQRSKINLQHVIETMQRFYGVMPPETPKRKLFYISPTMRQLVLVLSLTVLVMLVGVIIAPDIAAFISSNP